MRLPSDHNFNKDEKHVDGRMQSEPILRINRNGNLLDHIYDFLRFNPFNSIYLLKTIKNETKINLLAQTLSFKQNQV